MITVLFQIVAQAEALPTFWTTDATAVVVNHVKTNKFIDGEREVEPRTTF